MTNETIIHDKILEYIQRSHPNTVEEIIRKLVDDLDISRDIALRYITNLEKEGKLILSPELKEIPEDFKDYIRSNHATWYWLTLLLIIVTTIIVFTVPGRAYPLSYIRHILGIIFMIFLPGYSLIKTLYPTREIDEIERIGLSIGSSIAMVPLVGFLLNFTPWGIRLEPLTLGILLLTVILSTMGLLREHQEKTSL
jgi:hypothetical protein